MENVKLKTMELDSGETLGYLERDGGEQVLLLIHGNMQSSKHWDVLIDSLDPSFKVYAVDLRGTGISTYNESFDSLQELSNDVKLFADKLSLSRFSVMGWSTGGGVAMQLAADYPDSVESLILLSSLSSRGFPLFNVNEAGHSILSERLETKEEIKADKARYMPITAAYTRRNKSMLRAVWDTLIYTHNKPSEEKYEEYLDDMITQRNLLDIYYANNIFNISKKYNGLTEGTGKIENIKAPVLILWGENDLVISKNMTEELQEDFGDKAKFVLLQGSGHSPLIDDLDGLKNEVESFLKEEVLKEKVDF